MSIWLRIIVSVSFGKLMMEGRLRVGTNLHDAAMLKEGDSLGVRSGLAKRRDSGDVKFAVVLTEIQREFFWVDLIRRLTRTRSSASRTSLKRPLRGYCGAVPSLHTPEILNATKL